MKFCCNCCYEHNDWCLAQCEIEIHPIYGIRKNAKPIQDRERPYDFLLNTDYSCNFYKRVWWKFWITE